LGKDRAFFLSLYRQPFLGPPNSFRRTPPFRPWHWYRALVRRRSSVRAFFLRFFLSCRRWISVIQLSHHAGLSFATPGLFRNPFFLSSRIFSPLCVRRFPHDNPSPFVGGSFSRLQGPLTLPWCVLGIRWSSSPSLVTARRWQVLPSFSISAPGLRCDSSGLPSSPWCAPSYLVICSPPSIRGSLG